MTGRPRGGGTVSPPTGEFILLVAAVVGLVVGGIGLRVAAETATTACGGDLTGHWHDGWQALLHHLLGRGATPAWAAATGPGLTGNPQRAATVPGGWCYWPPATMAVATGSAAAITTWRTARRLLGTTGRVRFGQPTDARQATRHDMAPMLVPGPESTNGRFVIGELIEPTPNHRTPRIRRTQRDRLWLATEDPDRAPLAGPAAARQGPRGSVMLIGPTGAGKTSMLPAALATWEGSAIVISAKSDANLTLAVRSTIGEVAVFDPGAATPFPTARWTPLNGVVDHVTAARAGQALAEAIPTEGVEQAGFWKHHGEHLLTAYLIVAALPVLLQRDGYRLVSMAEMAYWVSERRGVKDHTIKRLLLAGSEPHEAVEVRQMTSIAATTLMAMETEDPKIKASVYATAVTAVRPYLEPPVALSATNASARWANRPGDHHPRRPRFIDLEWLMEADNTLYMTASEHEFARLGPVMGGALSTIVKDIHAWDIKGRRLPRPLLIVIDEAAQLRLDWLPQELSTLGGLGAIMVTCWQSLAQVKAIYGDNAASTVFANHRTKVIFAGVDDADTLNAVTKLLGQEHVHRQTHSHNSGSAGSVASTPTPEEFAPAHVLRQMIPGEAIVFHGTLPAAHVRTLRWWNEPDIRALITERLDDDPTTCPLTGQTIGRYESPIDAAAMETTFRDLRASSRQGIQGRYGAQAIRTVNTRCNGCAVLLKPDQGHRLRPVEGGQVEDWCDDCNDHRPDQSRARF